MVTATKAEIWAALMGNIDEISPTLVEQLARLDICTIVVNRSMSENHIGGDDVVDAVIQVLAVQAKGYSILTWYGPNSEVLIIGYRSNELNLVDTKEDVSIQQIVAECHSDDRAAEVKFDATPWFRQASDDDIIALIECDWGYDRPADEVAVVSARWNNELRVFFEYIGARNRVDNCGFECAVYDQDAIAWLKVNRKHLYDRHDLNLFETNAND